MSCETASRVARDILEAGLWEQTQNKGGVLNPKLEISPGKHVPRTRELGQLALPSSACFQIFSPAVMASIAPDAGDSLWAKNLFRLQCSLLYFFAAEFKIQPEWLGPHGGTLIKAGWLVLSWMAQCQGHVLAGRALNLSILVNIIQYFSTVSIQYFEWFHKDFHLTVPPSTFRKRQHSEDVHIFDLSPLRDVEKVLLPNQQVRSHGWIHHVETSQFSWKAVQKAIMKWERPLNKPMKSMKSNFWISMLKYLKSTPYGLSQLRQGDTGTPHGHWHHYRGDLLSFWLLECPRMRVWQLGFGRILECYFQWKPGRIEAF